MKLKKLYLGALLSLLGLGAVPASAVTIGFDPASATFTAGQNVTVDVVVSDLNGEIVSAFDLDVLYNSSVLLANGVLFGNQLGNPLLEAFTSSDTTVSGLVDMAEVSLLSDAQLDVLQNNVSVTLGTIQFVAQQDGDISSLGFNWGPGQDIKGFGNRVIYPVSVPEPGTSLLLAAALVALGIRRYASLA